MSPEHPPRGSKRINDPTVVRAEYASEERFLARRLSTWAELDGPLVEDLVVATLERLQPAQVLEVGCGTGDFSARVRDALGARYVAVDLSPRMAALTNARGIHTQVANIEHLPFRDGEFAAVLANRVLYHLPDLDRGLREIARVLRAAGQLVAVTYSEQHLAGLNELLGRPMIGPAFSAETGPVAMRRHFARVESHHVTGRAVFHSIDALRGFSAQQFGVPEPHVSERVDAVSMPFVAVYHHAVLLGISA